MESVQANRKMHLWTRLKLSWKGTNNWNKLMVALTGVIALANGCYTHYARKQFDAMNGQLQQMESGSKQTDKLIELYRQQTQLQKQQSIGTMGAVVSFNNVELNRDKTAVTISFTNSGHVVSPNAYVQFEMLHTSLDGAKQLSPPRHYDFTIPQFQPTPYVERRIYKLPYRVQPYFRYQDDTITVKGTIRFDNGFGDKFEKPFCVSWLGYARIEGEHEVSEIIGEYFPSC